MPENPSVMFPYLSQQFDLDDYEAISMPENPQSRQQEDSGLVSDMPAVVVRFVWKVSRNTRKLLDKFGAAMCIITIAVLPVGSRMEIAILALSAVMKSPAGG
ncbi:hypothetical protein GQ457_10G017000 [Hibiscus cannabinus]